MRRFAVILSCCAAIMAVGCSLDEVVEHGDTCRDGSGNVMTLEYINDGSNTYYRRDSTSYLDAFETNTCPDKSQGCYIDFNEAYYCMMKCPGGSIACNGNCIDPNTNVDFCGARGDCFGEDASNSRGTVCGEGSLCVRGKCEEKEQLVCGTSQKKCAVGGEKSHMECKNILTDRENCGDCGVICDENEVCLDGNCSKHVCKNACYSGSVCINLDEQCGNECVNCLALDGITTASCGVTDGKCKVGGCLSGYHIGENENGDICEVNTDEKCGASDSRETENCTLRVLENAEASHCENSACTELKCKENYSMLNGECSADSLESCAGVNCKELPGVGSVACVSGKCAVSFCLDDFHLSDGVCVSDEAESCGEPPVNCMAEGVKNASCDSGKCHVFECKDGYHLYENSCEVDDNANCGSHGSACTENSTCTDKTCVCDKGFHAKDDVCEADSIKACGRATNDCTNKGRYPKLDKADIACEDGQCVASRCNNGFELCNGECFNTTGLWGILDAFDTERNCGGCGKQFACDETQHCGMKNLSLFCVCDDAYHSLADGTCELNDSNNCGAHGAACSEHMTCKESGGGVWGAVSWKCVCSEGYHDYNGVCEADDVNNCGRHGKTCTTGNILHSAEVGCPKGTCQVVSCESGYDQCGNACVDLSTNKNHCGGCGQTCGSLHSCSEGRCICDATMCGSECVDTQTNASHCGSCNTKCQVPANATATCSSGRCGFVCKNGYTRCGSRCVNTKTDVWNCGECGVMCGSISHGETACTSGNCVFTCDSGYILIDGICQ